MTLAQRDATTLYMRGTGDEGFVHVTHLGEMPRFLGVAFEVDAIDDLHTLASEFEFSAKSVCSLWSGWRADGAGASIVIGHRVEVVADRASVGRLPSPTPAPRNSGRPLPTCWGAVAPLGWRLTRGTEWRLRARGGGFRFERRLVRRASWAGHLRRNRGRINRDWRLSPLRSG